MRGVLSLLQLTIVDPTTNATSERSFSALRPLKPYWRSTMSQERFNHCAVFHARKDDRDRLSAVDIAAEFVSAKDHRSGV